MKTQNFVAAVRSFSRRRRFRPYLVELHSGERIRVSHPEVLFLREELAIYVTPSNDYTVFDSSCVSRVFDEDRSLGARPPG